MPTSSGASPNHRRARAGAAARSPDHCQSCGRLIETEAHHWSREYPRADEVTADVNIRFKVMNSRQMVDHNM